MIILIGLLFKHVEKDISLSNECRIQYYDMTDN